ncbi:hypothetical protein E2C01_087075 [Portunus trituberculatus]|uniref:Uncharacterized protein n=1 Tax=Portunus trituberculatus TaxID=210409 RepID=A0A5B7JF70_PORTR|nr:hypothetical protein [Portunus trituberculatus]
MLSSGNHQSVYLQLNIYNTNLSSEQTHRGVTFYLFIYLLFSLFTWSGKRGGRLTYKPASRPAPPRACVRPLRTGTRDLPVVTTKSPLTPSTPSTCSVAGRWWCCRAPLRHFVVSAPRLPDTIPSCSSDSQ